MKKLERPNSTTRIPTVSSRAKMVNRQASREARLSHQPSVTFKEDRRRTSNHSDDSRRDSQVYEDHANQVFSLEETICELQSSLEKEREVNDGEVTALRRAKKSLHDEVLRLKIDRDSAGKKLEEEKKKHTKELDNMKKYAEGMKIALEILKKEKATEKHNNEQVLSLKVEVMRLESSIDEMNIEKENLMTITEELQNKNGKQTQENKELGIANQEMSTQIDDLTFRNETLRAERDALNNRNDTVVANVTALKVNSDILRSENEKLRSLLGEAQDALSKTKVDTLTAALVLEEENKQLSEMVADVQNALKDMAQENQALQIEIATQNGRKWKNDTEVTECTNCLIEFSLRVRKHHCRGCGDIFCNDCSSKQVFMSNLKVFIQMIICQLRLKCRASKSLNGCAMLASRDLGRENEMFRYFVDLHCML